MRESGYMRNWSTFGEQYSILPFMPGYFRMLEKAEGVLLPITKEQQNRNLTGQFFACFP